MSVVASVHDYLGNFPRESLEKEYFSQRYWERDSAVIDREVSMGKQMNS